jgi:hypothetical protein
MGSLTSAIRDDILDYVRRCQIFGEDVQYSPDGSPDCYGSHAEKLSKRNITAQMMRDATPPPPLPSLRRKP